ncbi:protein sprouty-like [Amphibalanus amphitrite]|uniref:protein sprouty-like n=1 Tax=Amphibalanus amphitrite TaxID=1232801 RepID=UPI001C91B797|nr:protein sprouty-like [Amphibalanus amphitrite]
MALHGRTVDPSSAPPAVHRRAQSASPPTPAVSLDRPRPGAERAANLYSLAPCVVQRRDHEATPARGRPGASQRSQHGQRGVSGRADSAEKASAAKARLREPGAEKRPVREQPGPLKKPSRAESSAGGDSGSEPTEDSIVCVVCGRCRCEACRTPRPLPQRLLCGRTCLLSADTCVDFASCMCCVKAAAYHCAASDSGSAAADRPCSCTPSGAGCCLRWTTLLLLTALVPCLACYWPLRAAARLAQACYGRGDGCTCPRPPEPGPPAGPVPRRADRPAVADPPRLCARRDSG